MKKIFKKITSVILVLIMSVGMCSVAIAVDDIPNGYTPIYTAEDLNNIRNNLSGKYVLMNDIDLSSYINWEPIGTLETPFIGNLNGNSFTLKNLNVLNAQGDNPSVGLFGTIMNSQVENVTVIGKINVNNDNGIRAGLICGEAYDSVITNCTTYGKLEVSTKAGVWVGGITGYLSTYSNNDEIKECRIDMCQNNATITANGGCNQETYELNFFVGGIVGHSYGIISKCSNYGDITAIGSNSGYDYFYTLAGGICGDTGGNIYNCYNVGNISSAGTEYVFSGGILGLWLQFGDIDSCYNIGQVKAEVKDSVDDYNFSASGGIIGEVESLAFPDSSDYYEYPACISSCYYLNNAEKAFGEASPQKQINIKSLTADEMAKQDSFEGFDFKNVWKMSDNENRPVLQNESTAVVINVKTKTGKSVRIEGVDKQNILSWSSTNEKIAVANNNGEIKGLSLGTAEVFISMNDGTVVHCNVTVKFSVFWWLIDLLFGWIK